MYQYIIPLGEKIIHERECLLSHTVFPLTDRDLTFYEQVSPVIGGQKYIIPPPTLCPESREQRRLSWRNERTLYRRKCSATGQNIISVYRPEVSFPVYQQEYWWSDAWDPLAYGRDFIDTSSFFAQFQDLYTAVPKASLWIRPDMENCDYCNFGSFSKNCYRCTAPFQSKDCFYTTMSVYCNGDVDGYFNIGSASLYECSDCVNCVDLQYSESCSESKQSRFLIDCVDCTQCFGCIGLHHKTHCILNVQFSPDEYQSILQDIGGDPKKRAKFDKDFSSLQVEIPVSNMQLNSCENVTGHKVAHAKNSHYVFECNRVHTRVWVAVIARISMTRRMVVCSLSDVSRHSLP